jgi:hypothetical protein
MSSTVFRRVYVLRQAAKMRPPLPRSVETRASCYLYASAAELGRQSAAGLARSRYNAIQPVQHEKDVTARRRMGAQF